MTIAQFGRYQIKSEVGRGGMSTVYLAYDPRFEREVAIKVLPREFLHNLNFRARFEREAKTIAALDHPAIVPVYDFGEEDGQPYLVMRYMTGGSLQKLLGRGPLPVAEAHRIISHLASALDEAHARKVLHRDLKPGNILFDQRGLPSISDFGIAKLSEEYTSLTGGGIVGTPAYMAPEQARGESDIDGRADIYALGAILFEMLTGRVPFEAETPTGQIIKALTEPVPRILDLNPNLPCDCQRVIEKAMAKCKEERYSYVEEMVDDLNVVVEANAKFVTISPAPLLNVSGVSAASIKVPIRADINRADGEIQKEQVIRESPAQEVEKVALKHVQPSEKIPVSAKPTRRALPKWIWLVGGFVILGLCVLLGGGGLIAYVLPGLKNMSSASPTPTFTYTPSTIPLPSHTKTPTITVSSQQKPSPTITIWLTNTPSLPTETLSPITTFSPSPTQLIPSATRIPNTITPTKRPTKTRAKQPTKTPQPPTDTPYP